MEPPNPAHDWNGQVVDDQDDDDFRPTRTAFHEDLSVSAYLLRRVAAAVPLKIAASQIASQGSGLFATKEVPDGQELFRSQTPFTCVDRWETSICHYCLRDTESPAHPEEGCFGASPKTGAKACMGCRVARFCSKTCQKKGWRFFHKDECKMLSETPSIRPEHLLVYRILFWQKRNGLTSEMGKALALLENHFADYSEDSDRATDIFHATMAIHQTSGTKMALRAVWRLVPAVMTNAIKVRAPHSKEPYGLALDLTASVINHSCSPNAFIFFEGGKAYCRSLRTIGAGEEITISYTEPTIDVSSRNELLKEDHFFDCHCNRCIAERKEERAIFHTAPDKLSALHQAQKDIAKLMFDAAKAAYGPGRTFNSEGIAKIETSLRTITCRAFPEGRWPDHIDPLPSARLALALHHAQGDDRPAMVRNALKGALLNRHRDGPESVNDVFDLMNILLVVVGPLPAASPRVLDDAMFPGLVEMQRVIAGLSVWLSREADRVFGRESKYAMTIDVYSTLLETSSGARRGTEQFEKEFERAQARLLAWAGMDAIHGFDLS